MTIEQSEQGLVEAVAAEICGDVARRAIELMRFLASHGGRVSADHSGLDQFCDDRPGGEDTFNICCKAGYIEQVQSGFSGDEYSAVLLDKGRDRLSTFHPNVAEPTGYLYHWPEDPGRTSYFRRERISPNAIGWLNGWTETPLYAHPPVPQDDARADVRGLVEAAQNVLAAMDRYNTENGTSLGGAPFFRLGTAIAKVDAALTHPSPTADVGEGYREAFYELAAMLDLPDQPISPREAWEGQMKPRILAALSPAGEP